MSRPPWKIEAELDQVNAMIDHLAETGQDPIEYVERAGALIDELREVAPDRLPY